MTLEYACIAPHGEELIPQLASHRNGGKFAKTREGIRKLSSEVANARPDTIIIASPHNLRLLHHIAIVMSENSTGTLGKTRSREQVRLSVKCDRKFAGQLLQRAMKDGLPVVGANYGTSEGGASDMPMDAGTLVPLWFPFKQQNLKSEVVIVTPSREIPLRQNFEFGIEIGQLTEKSDGRYVFIASADQAHAHSKAGPYGFSKAASNYDNLVCYAIEDDELRSILKLDPRLVEAAKPDSLWQLAILAGILEEVRMKPSLVSYQVPTYYGMICASFHGIR